MKLTQEQHQQPQMKALKKELRAIAPKINTESAEWYSRTFQSLNAGATFILDAFPTFYTQTLTDMRGQFTEGELCMILDVLNRHGTILLSYGSAAGLVGHHIGLAVSDSFVYYPGAYEEKWNIQDKDDFVNRINGLHRFNKICLEIWAAGFWEQHETVSVDEYCKILLDA